MILRAVCKFILYRIFGWSIEGKFPKDQPKYIVVVAPHTSNWDFFLGLFTRTITQDDIKFIGKHSIFFFPLGILLRALGGYPVDRSKSTNFVDAVVDIFNSKEKFAITITPEGTRSKVERFKTGFYYIAKKANVPLVPVTINGPRKLIHIGPHHFVADTLEEELAFLTNYYKGVEGINKGQGIYWDA